MRRLLLLVVLIAVTLTAAVLTACGFVEVHDVHLHFVVDGAPFRDMSVSAYTAGGLDVGTMDGYYFDGWYADAAYTQAANPARMTEESTLYGHWVKQSPKVTLYTITFVLESGTKVGSTQAATLADIVYPDAPEREGYVFAEWQGKPAVLNEDITLVASYWRMYTVTFVDEDGTTLAIQQAKEGDYATPPVPPIKASTAQYHYEFIGWTPDQGDYNKVQCNMKVYATFRSVTNRYTYTLHLDNGQEDVVRTVDYGAQITLPTPTKAPYYDEAYTFAGWDTDGNGEINDIATRFRLYADMEAWAIYNVSPRMFAVTFVVDEDSVQGEVAYGQCAEYPADTPTRAATAQYSYTFAGWDTDGDGQVDDGCLAVYDDLSAVAVFTATVNLYSYSFVDSVGTVYAEAVDVPYGTTVSKPQTTPTMPATDSVMYTFSYWSNYEEDMPLHGDMLFEAVFNVEVRLYTIAFKDGNTTLAEYYLPYGTVIDYDEANKPYPFPTVSPDSDVRYAYAWENWVPNYTVTKDYRFNLEKYAYDYTVTWQVDDDTVWLSFIRNGDVLALPAVPQREGYVFAGWQGYSADLCVYEDLALTAVWQQQ